MSLRIVRGSFRISTTTQRHDPNLYSSNMKELLGWNIIPANCSAEVDFENAPKWLKALALTPFFERFAYPIAVRRGLGVIWTEHFKEAEIHDLETLGWVVKRRAKSNQEKFREGSLGLLTSHSSKTRSKVRLPRIALTRWGLRRSLTKSVHSYNATVSHFKNGTYPPGLE